MRQAAVVAMGYRYPTPTGRAELAAALESNATDDVDRHLRKFLAGISALELGEWEELHTTTLDLTALFVPYVGHVVWGENYRRGAFMAELKVAMESCGVELGGELPDHIEPVLRYLAVAEEPLGDLVDVLPSVLVTMRQVLHTASPDNPYRHLLAATVDLAADLRPVTIGKRR